MMLKKILRIILLSSCVIIGLIVVFILISVAPVDRTPIRDLPAYSTMMKKMSGLDSIRIPAAVHGFRVGYSRVSITPAQHTALGGYGNRLGKPFTSIRDSVFVRTLVVDNGASQVAIVAADLLFIPPAVTDHLRTALPSIGFSLDNTFMGATHSHNSIGNWGKGASRIFYGAYQDSIVNFISQQIVASIQAASRNMRRATIRAGVIPVPGAVQNRLTKEGHIDSLLRAIEVHRDDSSKLLLLSYTAHATCLFSRDLRLSRDYPGKLVDDLESKGYDFAMFMAGAVGSHGYKAPADGDDCIDWMANQVSDSFLEGRSALSPVHDSTLLMVRIPLELSDPQVKISPDWKVRAWLFRAAMGEYPVYLTALRLGDMIMLGTPCDFSGELDPALDLVASQHHVQTMVTSFNGGYAGYVTPSRYYDIIHSETQLMNWYAPGTGEYIEACLEKLIDVTAPLK
jgi:hypothetical protein